MKSDLEWCLCGGTSSTANNWTSSVLQPPKNERTSVIDYYAVVGIEAGQVPKFKTREEELQASIASRITDIAFIGPSNEAPAGWAVVGNRVLNGAILCIKRVINSGRSDYVTSIRLAPRSSLHGKHSVEVTKEVAVHLTNGSEHPIRSGNFTEQDLLLVIERAPAISTRTSLSDARFHLAYRTAGITNMFILTSTNQAKRDVCVLEENLSKTRLLGNGLFLGFTRSKPYGGVCSTPLQACTLDRYPSVDYEDFPLPSGELPLFCFPRGYYLQYRDHTDAPRPEIFSFVLTSSSGVRVYVNCLMMFEELQDSIAVGVWSQFSQLQNVELPRVVASEETGHGFFESVAAQVVGGFIHAASSVNDVFASIQGTIWASSTSTSGEFEESGAFEATESLATDRQYPIRRRYSWPMLSSIPESGCVEPPGIVRTATSISGLEIHSQSKDNEQTRRHDNFRLYGPKCVCVLSSLPFYRTSQNFLRDVYSLSLSPSRIPLEAFVLFFVSQVPCPRPGGATLEVQLTGSQLPISLQQPSFRILPLCEISFLGPLQTLSLNSVLDVFALILQEKQVIFVSSGLGGLLAEVMETFRMLLFPLEWQGLFVNRLPSTLVAQLSEAPGGYLMGILVSEQDALHLNNLRAALSIPPDVAIISLDKGGNLNISPEQAAPRQCLPRMALKQLEERLRVLCERAHLMPGKQDLSAFDAAFSLSSPPSHIKRSEERVENIGENVRDAFLRFMIELLGSVRSYLAPDGASFDHQRYLSDAQPHLRLFLEALVETQMFSVLVSKHLSMDYIHDHRMSFFELAAEEAKLSLTRRDIEMTCEHGVKQRFQNEAPAESLGVVRLALSKSSFGFYRDESSTAVRINGPHATVNGPLFTYHSWPTPLRDSNLPESINLEVQKMQRRFTSGLLNQGLVFSLIRSPYEDPIVAPFGVHKSSKQALSIWCLVIMSTPALIFAGPKERAINHVLRVLGIVSLLDNKQLLFLVDEPIWRALMVSCASVGGKTFSEAVQAVYKTRAETRTSTASRLTSNRQVPALTYYTFCKLHTVQPDIQAETDYFPPSDHAKHAKLENSGWEWLRAHCPSLSGNIQENVSSALQGWIAHHQQSQPIEEALPEKCGNPRALIFSGLPWGSLSGAYRTRQVDVWVSTVCPACFRPFLDEEVMDLWRKGVASEHDLLIGCPNCKTSFLPCLKHREWTASDLFLPGQWMGNESEASTSELYVNPMLLRSFSEELLIHAGGGNDAYDMAWLEQNCPVFFWNTAWWCERLRIPFPWKSQENVAFRLGSRIPTDMPPSLRERFVKITSTEEVALNRMLKVLSECDIHVDGIREALPHLYELKSDNPCLQVPYHVMHWLATMIEGDKFGVTGSSSNGKSFDEMYTTAVSKVTFRTNGGPVESALPEPEQQPHFSETILSSMLHWLQTGQSAALPSDVSESSPAEERAVQPHLTAIKDLTQTAPSPGLWRYRAVFGRLPP